MMLKHAQNTSNEFLSAKNSIDLSQSTNYKNGDLSINLNLDLAHFNI